jgi:glucuronoarabinoxylan endo-1,4-beta-xylanase
MKNIMIDYNAEYQEIDGFGVCGAFMQARNLLQYPSEERKHILDILFSNENGAGISIIRNIVGDSGVWGNCEDGPTPSIEPQKGIFNYMGDEDQIWFMNEARERGCRRFVSTVWSPPAWMKTNCDVANGGTLKAENFADFAEYLADYIEIYKKHHGIDIYAISPANEPNLKIHYSSCEWSGAQLSDFYANYLSQVFKRRNIIARTFGPETCQFGNHILKKYSDMLPGSKDMPDIAAMHGYEDSVIETIDTQYADGKKIWMSEICEIGHNEYAEFNPTIQDGLNVARSVHDYLTKANCSAYIYFWGMSKYDNNSAMVKLDLERMTYTVCKRVYTFGNFSRFVKPGFIRIRAEHDGKEDILVSAYKGVNNELVFIALNLSNEDRSFKLVCNGFTVDRLTAYLTDEKNNIKEKNVVILEDQSFALSLKAKSITSFIGRHG